MPHMDFTHKAYHEKKRHSANLQIYCSRVSITTRQGKNHFLFHSKARGAFCENFLIMCEEMFFNSKEFEN